MFKVKVFTIFPEAFPGTLGLSLPLRAMQDGLFSLEVIDIKNFGIGKHKKVDEYPFGGGAGMLMRADVLGEAIESEMQRESEPPLIILTSARGKTFDQKTAFELSEIKNKTLYIICGRFEGVDERFMQYYKALELNLGKFVLFGGEAAAMCIVEAVVRLLPDVLGNHETTKEESYAVGTEFENLMEYPQYTLPRVWHGISVPEVLLSGNHAKIKEWKLEEAKKITNKNKV